jgi:chromosome segregation ATPase
MNLTTNDEIAQLRAENAQLRDKIAEKDIEKKELYVIIDNLTTRVFEQTNKIRDLETQLDTQDHANFELGAKVAKQTDEINSLVALLNAKDDANVELRTKHAEKDIENEELCVVIADLTAKVSKQSDEIGGLEEQCESLINKNDEYSATIKDNERYISENNARIV